MSREDIHQKAIAAYNAVIEGNLAQEFEMYAQMMECLGERLQELTLDSNRAEQLACDLSDAGDKFAEIKKMIRKTG